MGRHVDRNRESLHQLDKIRYMRQTKFYYVYKIVKSIYSLVEIIDREKKIYTIPLKCKIFINYYAKLKFLRDN